jgi:nucleoside transporter
MHRDEPESPVAVGIQLTVMMFLQFFVWGSWYVTVGNFIAETGWDASVIGWAYTVGPIAAIVSPLFLGLIADRFFAAQRVLAVLHLLGGGVMLLLPTFAAGPGRAWEPFILLLFVHMLCYMPTLALTNTVAFRHLGRQEFWFPLVRVFGTLGWILANFVVSKLYSADKLPLQFQVAGGAALLLAVWSLLLPHTPPQQKERGTLASALGAGALGLLLRPSFLVFLLASFLICIPLAAYYSFAPVFVDASGLENPAFRMSFGQWAEVGFMLVMPFCFGLFGVKWMLAIGMLAWVVRYGLFSVAAEGGAPSLVLGGILLHGICYDFFFVTGQIYVDQRAPSDIRAQAQGLLVLMTQGLGLGIGARLTAAVVTGHTANGTVAWAEVWRLGAIAAGVVLVLFLLLFHERSASRQEPA